MLEMKYNVWYQQQNKDDSVEFIHVGTVEAQHVNPEVEQSTALTMAKLQYNKYNPRIAVSACGN